MLGAMKAQPYLNCNTDYDHVWKTYDWLEYPSYLRKEDGTVVKMKLCIRCWARLISAE